MWFVACSGHSVNSKYVYYVFCSLLTGQINFRSNDLWTDCSIHRERVGMYFWSTISVKREIGDSRTGYNKSRIGIR